VEDDWDDWLEDMVEEIADRSLATLWAKLDRAAK
jgi:hypothetical protein